jgi:hypothetical protein
MTTSGCSGIRVNSPLPRSLREDMAGMVVRIQHKMIANMKPRKLLYFLINEIYPKRSFIVNLFEYLYHLCPCLGVHIVALIQNPLQWCGVVHLVQGLFAMPVGFFGQTEWVSIELHKTRIPCCFYHLSLFKLLSLLWKVHVYILGAELRSRSFLKNNDYLVCIVIYATC